MRDALAAFGWSYMCGVGAAVVLLAACDTERPRADPPGLDAAAFRSTIYPALLRDCGFPACHASSQPGLEQANSRDNGRNTAALRIAGPGRARLDPNTPLKGAFVDAEIDDAFERSRGLVYRGEDCEDSPLLRKPLEVDEGGAPHRGTGVHGRDIFPNKDAAAYQVLRDWACGAANAPATSAATTPTLHAVPGHAAEDGWEVDAQ